MRAARAACARGNARAMPPPIRAVRARRCACTHGPRRYDSLLRHGHAKDGTQALILALEDTTKYTQAAS